MFDGMRKKAEGADGGEDRISDLPDALLHRVLSQAVISYFVCTCRIMTRYWLCVSYHG